jgi:hypothetical protein
MHWNSAIAWALRTALIDFRINAQFLIGHDWIASGALGSRLGKGLALQRDPPEGAIGGYTVPGSKPNPQGATDRARANHPQLRGRHSACLMREWRAHEEGGRLARR